MNIKSFIFTIGLVFPFSLISDSFITLGYTKALIYINVFILLIVIDGMILTVYFIIDKYLNIKKEMIEWKYYL